MATIYKPYDLFYYKRDNKNQTRCVESFGTKNDLLERIAELKAIHGNDFVFPDYDNSIGKSQRRKNAVNNQ